MAAVIGTGIMGAAMARNLVAAGIRTTVWDRSPAALEPLVAAGAVAAPTPAEAVRGAMVVITMLPTADVVGSVMLDKAVLARFEHGAVWAQMGTIGVDATAEIDARLRSDRPDVLFVDAPVSGSKAPAEAGQLLILAEGRRPGAQRGRRRFAAIAGRSLPAVARGGGRRARPGGRCGRPASPGQLMS